MFRLSDEEIRNSRILDCPGGVSNFGLTIRERDGEAVSADPFYALTVQELRRLMTLDRQTMAGYIRHNSGLYLEDAALPVLPFPVGHFDIVVSAFLLLVYDTTFGPWPNWTVSAWELSGCTPWAMNTGVSIRDSVSLRDRCRISPSTARPSAASTAAGPRRHSPSDELDVRSLSSSD